MADQILGRGAFPFTSPNRWSSESRNIAARERFFHWTFEFPEIFCDATGEPLAREPGLRRDHRQSTWEMLRGDRGDAATRDAARTASEQLSAFVDPGYRAQGDGHVNLYQLFVERTLALLRSGGRLGMVLPSGLATDHGRSRRALLDGTRIDNLVSLENREAMFPVHRSLKFLLLSATQVAERDIPCRFGIQQAEALDGLPELGRIATP